MSERYFENREFTSLQLTDETIKYFEFIDCTFIDCTVEKCTIAKCRFSECTFVNCHIADVKSEIVRLCAFGFKVSYVTVHKGTL